MPKQNMPKQNMHNLATVNSTTPHVALIGPSVRRLLDSYGLDRHSIKPSGHKGQLLKGDVLKYIDEHAKAEIKFTHILQDKIPASGPMTQESNIGYVDVGLSSARQAIARQMMESKNTTPHTYNTIDCRVDNLFAICKKFDHSVSIYDFVIKAAALALCLLPHVNTSWSDGSLVQLSGINIGIAVNSPNGVITPVINNADQLDVSSISQTVMELKEQAKNGLLRPEQLQNASFTITNLGNLGVKSFTAIITPPQSATLTVGDSQVLVNDNYKLSNVINVTLCCDGRVIDEQLASEWLTVFKGFIENPLQMGL
ncbi:pyruvate dehydrogenase complex dihydrolipoamide acetyltransferase [Paramuricea clavata]|nr:pyruvate dehydrogenase complex dihydrolipoamide acetyltransferase [Paramuricea clavata]